MEFGRKESQVWQDGDPSEDDITEDKDFTAENLIDEAYIDDSREDENTQNISVLSTGGDDQTENQPTSNKVVVVLTLSLQILIHGYTQRIRQGSILYLILNVFIRKKL